MITILTLALAFGATQQPQQSHQPRRRAEPVTRSPANLAPTPNGAAAPQAPAPRNAYDSTVTVVVNVGRAVADVKAELDRFQMTAQGNAPGEVLEKSDAFRSKCQDLAAAARRGPRMMCRHCASRAAQVAFDRYKAFLPTLAQLGTRCSNTLQRLRGRDPDAAVQALRRESRNIGDFMVTGFRQYEARLTQVREVLGGPAPRRSGS
jgi:hypothetical protein